MQHETKKQSLGLRLLGWTIYAAAFGYVEALVVVYLRRLMHMPAGWDYPRFWGAQGLPFNSHAIFTEMAHLGILHTEFTREAATIILLLGAACAAGQTGRERLGLFLYTFAVWDLTYYLWLWLWTGFPHGLGATDIYYLLPIAWYGPVWFPLLVFMPVTILAAVILLRQDAAAP
jgi:hypothetical protein